MTVAALLIAIGVAIPLFSPVRFWVEPVSFTLASHVPIFLAMMISPGAGVAVALGTAVAFFSISPVVALRAFSHLVFVIIGGLYLQRRPDTLDSPARAHVFSLLVAVLHSFCEVVVVAAFYFGGSMLAAYAQFGFVQSVLLISGVGYIAHSLVDFEIAYVIYKVLHGQRAFSALWNSGNGGEDRTSKAEQRERQRGPEL
jgi:niacin transporter